MPIRSIVFAAAALTLALQPVRADVGKVPVGTEIPEQLREVGIDQKLGSQIPLDAEFDGENGQKVRIVDKLTCPHLKNLLKK